jgi:hypothetical protein
MLLASRSCGGVEIDGGVLGREGEARNCARDTYQNGTRLSKTSPEIRPVHCGYI